MGNNSSSSSSYPNTDSSYARRNEEIFEEKKKNEILHKQYDDVQRQKYEYMKQAHELKIQAEKTKSDNEQLRQQLHREKLEKERLLNRPKQCQYASEGCTVVLTAVTIEQHESLCFYKELKCPLSHYNLCKTKWNGKMSTIYEHFQDCHKDHLKGDVNKELFIPHIDNERRFLHLVKLGSYYFFVHIKMCKTNGVAFTVQHIGSVVEATKWCYEVHVYKKGEPKRKYVYNNKCLSVRDSADSIIDMNDCAVLPIAYARTMTDTDFLYYKFYIKNVVN